VSAFEPVRYAAITDVGVKRSHNQDACAAQPAPDAPTFEAQGHVFVVADGMGGHAVGEKASAKAVRDIPFLYTKHARDGVIPAIRRAFQETNGGIFAIGQGNPEFRGMGTTSTALVLRPEGAWFGHVGDSRAYRVRDGQIEQLTFDHSWVWEIARREGKDPDELGDFKRNVIIRSLGPDPDVEVDIEGPYPLQPGDVFLLCSDGLTGVVTAQEAGAVISALPLEEAAKFLVSLANLRGGPDNITVLLVEIPDGKGSGKKKAKSAGSGGPATGLSAWLRRVPWPFVALGAGCSAALICLVMGLNGVRGAPMVFLLAAIGIVLGLIGLFGPQAAERAGKRGQHGEGGPRELHVYKKYDCRPCKELVERLAHLESLLLEGMRGQSIPADYTAHAVLSDTADAAKGEEPAAFRARCRSLHFLIEAFQKSRPRLESFQPSWMPSAQ
jgi:PPM family protein phosphatase